MNVGKAKLRLTVLLLALLCSATAGAQTLLFPGDIVFLGYRHDDPDAFAFMLMVDVGAGTQIHFTDNGWNGNTGEFNTNEGTTVWTASVDYPRGTIIRYDYPPAGEFDGYLQGLSTIGDQIIAFQGDALAPYFIAGVGSNDRWLTEGDDPTSSYSFVPPTLELGLTVRAFVSEIDNGYYDPIGHLEDGAISAGTPYDFLRAVNDSSRTWTRTSTGDGFDFPAWALTLNMTPTVRVDSDAHAVDFGPVVINTTSAETAVTVSGYGLEDDLMVSAPAGFEISLVSGSGFSNYVGLTPSSGSVAETTIYVRCAPTAEQFYSGTLLIESEGATTATVDLAAEGALALVLADVTAANGAGDLAGSDIFERALADQTLQLDMVGVPDDAIGKLRVTLPAGWTGLAAGNVSLSGSAFTSAAAAVVGQEIEITGAALTDAATGSVIISGLTTPDPTALDDDGVQVLTTEVATTTGSYLALFTQPVAYVTIPIQNLRDYGTDYLPLDEFDTVAIDGTAIVGSGTLSTTSLQTYIQDATGGMYVNFIGDPGAVLLGNRYIVKGVVGHYRGNFRVVPQDAIAGNVFDLGESVLPEPAVLTVAQILTDPESIEGTLVHVDDVSIVSGTWGGDATLVVSDDGGTTTINLRVDATTDVNEMDEPTGTFGLTGILYQYDTTAPHSSGYRILPRSQEDFSNASPVDGGTNLPGNFALLPSYPNPFNAQTDLHFSLPRAAAVDLSVYDLKGRCVRTLLSGQMVQAGQVSVPFNGRSDQGADLASGIYFVRFAAGDVVQVDKLTLVK